MNNIKFYIARKGINQDATVLVPGYSWESGRWEETTSKEIASTTEIDVTGFSRVVMDVSSVLKRPIVAVHYYWFNKEMELIEKQYDSPVDVDADVPNDACFFAIEIYFEEELLVNWVDMEYMLFKQITPHYKTLKKQYKKESNQMFFRETLDGKVTLFGNDYEFVKNCSINDKIIFDIYKNGSKYITTTLNKTDCKFDHFKKSVELKPVANDSYTDILSKYDNKYDLIKLSPARSWINLTKRCVLQIYILGENVISNYAGGEHWESEVNEPIYDPNAMEEKYFFKEYARTAKEINLSGFNYDINSTYLCVDTQDCWNAVSGRGSIKFIKVYDKDDLVSWQDQINFMSSDANNAIYTDEYGYPHASYDTYRIAIYSGVDGTGQLLYTSNSVYGKDTDRFTLMQGQGKYKMTATTGGILPVTFNLGENTIDYSIWARMLCDVPALSDGTPTYDLPYDDFAAERINYKKCIGIQLQDSESAIMTITQLAATSTTPTPYGKNDYGLYFDSPYFPTGYYTGQTVYPLARNSWGNTSLWVILKTDYSDALNLYEKWCRKTYKLYTIKDCFNIGNAIGALLKEISGGKITHEPNEQYSKFLYGNGSVYTSRVLAGCSLHITQKTNILKGEYDQAAQKAEITLKQIMEMLRDCFRCYWYVDSQNRFIIEHVSYFTNGFTYESSNIGVDCTTLFDKFNKKNIQYCQHELEYDKSDLQSRFEFGWMDESTDSMSGLRVDINNEYIQKDNVGNINPNAFSTDVDYMLFSPSEFSNDGFALLSADSYGTVPIPQSWALRDNLQSKTDKVVTPQNFVLSWNMLINHYMLDMPGTYISYNNLREGQLAVLDTRKFVKHDVDVLGLKDDPDVTKMVKTSFGNGYIDSMSSNIDTGMVNITLAYTSTE